MDRAKIEKLVKEMDSMWLELQEAINHEKDKKKKDTMLHAQDDLGSAIQNLQKIAKY